MSREIVLPPLEPWQSEVFKAMDSSRSSGRVFVIKARRQCGKSILAIVMLIKFSLEERSVSVCIEPTQAQSRRVFKQIVDCLQGSGAIESSNSTLLSIQFVNGSEILFKSAEQKDGLRGFSVSGLLVIDEGAFIPADIYSILYPCTDANNAPILVISTPLFQSGDFYDLYVRGLQNDSRVKSFDWSRFDTSKYLSKEKLEYYRMTVPPLKFRSEYLGEFITEGSYIFGDIGRCVGGYSDRTPVYCGIDWGSGNGGDFTVITFMDDSRCVTRIESFRNVDAVVQIERISQMLNGMPTLKTVQVEMNSIGRIFYENLRRNTKVPIRQFVTTNDSKRTIIERLIAAFQKGDITVPDDDELLRELQHYAMEKTQKGYTYNGADGVNDDYVMSLALCYDLAYKSAGKYSISFV